MTKNLMIVESPAKAKTIEKFLGKDFTVKSCYGHIRDLEKSKFSIDIDKDFEPKYVIPADKKDVVKELKNWPIKQTKYGSQRMRTAKERPFPGIYVRFWELIRIQQNASFFMKSPNLQSKRQLKIHVTST
jgi:hypothetical protein